MPTARHSLSIAKAPYDSRGLIRCAVVSAAIAAIALPALPAAAQKAKQSGEWIGTWAASPQPVWAADFPVPLNMPRNLRDETLRQIVHVSLGGNQLRIVLSNRYGDAPLMISAAHVALSKGGGAIDPSSDHALTFSGQSSIGIPPGAPIVSDPVALQVPAEGDLAVSLYFAETTPLSTMHWEGVQTAYIGAGNHAGDAEFKADSTMKARAFLAEVMVDAPQGARAVVTFGDSITDGANSTPDANHRWPDVLAGRLQKQGEKVAVLNEGISGARVLANRMGDNALARFDDDVLSQPHADTVVLMMGINDIGWPGTPLAPRESEPSAEDIIAGYKQLIARAHIHGWRIIGATLTPFEDTFQNMPFQGYYTAAKEAEREAVNDFIRHSGAFDGVIDFDAMARDASNPKHIKAAYDSGDHLHPNDAGYAAMANGIDLALLSGQGQGAQPRLTQQQAAPSPAPAAQATTQAVGGHEKTVPRAQTGTEQAAPSPLPANQATPGAIEKQEGKGTR